MRLAVVEIEINTRCNLKCDYCPNSEYQRVEDGEMDLDLFRKAMKDLQEIGFEGRFSYHFYGEPLLNKNLMKYVEIASSMLSSKVTHLLFTNGTLFTEEKYAQLKTAGMNSFIITHHIGVKDLPVYHFIDKLNDVDRANILINPYNRIKLTTRAGLVKLDHLSNESNLTRPCLIPKRSMYVTKDGNVVPCFEDYNQIEVMGNIKDNSLKEIWNSNRYQEFILNAEKGDRFKNKLCSTCTSDQLMIF